MKKTITLALILIGIAIQSPAQSSKEIDRSSLESVQGSGPDDFPELVNAHIPGAPKLGKPQLIMGNTMPVMGEGSGWAAPAMYDWNNDGKKDLLIGEFATAAERTLGNSIGHLIRVYKNVGTNGKPKFSDLYSYGKGADSDYTSDFNTGNPLSIHSFCCFPFIPRFADLNNDGFTDLLSGQYSPGYITWFRGSKNGFLPGVKLDEIYSPKSLDKKMLSWYSLPFDNPESRNYWQYSAVDFGDFDNDGDQDMIVGGGALRLSENIGTKFEPLFGKRELLLDINGNPLKVSEIPKENFKTRYNPIYEDHDLPPPAGTTNAIPYVIDWNNDGVLDILVTYDFTSKRDIAVTYFQGLKTKEGLRYEVGVPLFKTKNGKKEFPGSWLNIWVTDWNDDGVKDLLIGTSVATLNGIYNYELSWQWEKDTGIIKKNPAYFSTGRKKSVVQQIKYAEASQKKMGLSDEEWRKKGHKTAEDIIKRYYGNGGYKNKTLAHKGYVYVMLGEKKKTNN